MQTEDWQLVIMVLVIACIAAWPIISRWLR